MAHHCHQAWLGKSKKVILRTTDEDWNESSRLSNMTHSKADTASNLMDIHVCRSLKLHAILLNTVASVHRLLMTMNDKQYMSMTVNQTGNDTAIYGHKK